MKNISLINKQWKDQSNVKVNDLLKVPWISYCSQQFTAFLFYGYQSYF